MVAAVDALVVFFFNDTATTEIYTLSLHDALPISRRNPSRTGCRSAAAGPRTPAPGPRASRLRPARRHRPARASAGAPGRAASARGSRWRAAAPATPPARHLHRHATDRARRAYR